MNTLKYKLFIDDERFPVGDDPECPWVMARNSEEAKTIIRSFGFPCYISFDHDLGDQEPTGHDIAKWMIEYDLDHNVIPEGFDFYVHSQNCVGFRNIEGLLRQYLSVKSVDKLTQSQYNMASNTKE